jgi:hypothetical protein
MDSTMPRSAYSTFSLEGGLGAYPVRISNEGLPRPCVALHRKFSDGPSFFCRFRSGTVTSVQKLNENDGHESETESAD